MGTNFKSVSELQGRLKSDIMAEIQGNLTNLCIEIVQKYLNSNVYEAYAPQGEYAYDRTFQLLNSVTVGELSIGYKYATFEIYMNTDEINAYVTDDPNEWNQHASVDPMDVSEYIPLWVEEGTSGSLWDREGAHYMQDAHFDLSGGKLARELADGLRSRGWRVTMI